LPSPLHKYEKKIVRLLPPPPPTFSKLNVQNEKGIGESGVLRTWEDQIIDAITGYGSPGRKVIARQGKVATNGGSALVGGRGRESAAAKAGGNEGGKVGGGKDGSLNSGATEPVANKGKLSSAGKDANKGKTAKDSGTNKNKGGNGWICIHGPHLSSKSHTLLSLMHRSPMLNEKVTISFLFPPFIALSMSCLPLSLFEYFYHTLYSLPTNSIACGLTLVLLDILLIVPTQRHNQMKELYFPWALWMALLSCLPSLAFVDLEMMEGMKGGGW